MLADPGRPWSDPIEEMEPTGKATLDSGLRRMRFEMDASGSAPERL